MSDETITFPAPCVSETTFTVDLSIEPYDRLKGYMHGLIDNNFKARNDLPLDKDFTISEMSIRSTSYNIARITVREVILHPQNTLYGKR